MNKIVIKRGRKGLIVNLVAENGGIVSDTQQLDGFENVAKNIEAQRQILAEGVIEFKCKISKKAKEELVKRLTPNS